MSESVVFELKLQIEHLQEKLKFLAGGSNGAELVEALMEKDKELERNTYKLKEVETRMFQLGEGAKRVDAKRRELARQCEHQGLRMGALETELGRHIDMSSELRRQITDTTEELDATQETLRKTQAEMVAAEEVSHEALTAARAEASQLQTVLEGQREKIEGVEKANTGLEEIVAAKTEEVKSVEERRKEVAARGREIKAKLEVMLGECQENLEKLQGQRDTLEDANGQLRRRLEEKAQHSLEQETKCGTLSRECGSLKTSLEGAQEEIASAAKELAAVRANKEEADETLLEKDKENAKLKVKIEGYVQEVARLKHRAKQDVSELKQRMEEQSTTHKDLEATLQDQMRRQEDDNNLMVDTLVEDKTDLERKLTVSKAECARVSAEGISLKKEALIKSKKTEATSKAEARWRARAEETLAATSAENRELHAELDKLRFQANELASLQAENKDLKDRIERQEAYQKRKMEKEKKERARSLGRSTLSSSTSGASGGAGSGRQLLPLPPAMSDSCTSDAHETPVESVESSIKRVTRPTASSSYRRSNSGSSATGTRPGVVIKPPTPKSSADSAGGGVHRGARRGRRDSDSHTPTLSPYQPPVSPDADPCLSPSTAPANRVTTTGACVSPKAPAGDKHFFSTPPADADATPAVATPTIATPAVATPAAAPVAPAPVPTPGPTPSPAVVTKAFAPKSDDKENGGRQVMPRRSSAPSLPGTSNVAALVWEPSCSNGSARGGRDGGERSTRSRKSSDSSSVSSGGSESGGRCGGKLTGSAGRLRSRGLGVAASGNRATTPTPGGRDTGNGPVVVKGGGGGGVGSGTRGTPLESRKIQSVSKSTSVGKRGNENVTTRYPSRGRRAVAAKVAAPRSRSSSEGLQSRAALGWR